MSMGSGMGSMGQGPMNGGQTSLSERQMHSDSFRMLEQNTGLNAAELQQRYASSGARNFGQFASAIVVSKNLGLDSNRVLSGIKEHSLQQTLQENGVRHDTAKAQIKRAQREIKEADKRGSKY